jgi:type II secretory pathway pseudopilin PulG
MLRLRQQSRRAFTLTEAAIVLGIVGLILGAIWVAASSVYNNMRIKRTNEQILVMVQGIRSIFAASAVTGTSGTGSLITQLVDARIIPSDVVINNTTLSNSFGGAITINNATITVAGDAFELKYARVPRNVCAEIGVRLTSSARDTGLFNVTLGSTTTTLTSWPLNLTTALSSCNNASDINEVAFVFQLRG